MEHYLNTSDAVKKFNALSLRSGDSVFFEGGKTYFGTLLPPAQGILISSSGTGRAKITGLKTVSNWESIGNNLYEATLPVSQLNLVVKDGKPVHKGTYPDRDALNGGYLKISSHVGKTSITDNSLPAELNIPVGSEVVIRCKKWVIDRCIVTKHSGGTIEFTGLTYAPENGWGYFLQNAVAFCNRDGEWCFNPGTKKITMYCSDGAPQNVQYAALQNLLHTNGKANLKVDNIDFEGSNGDNIMVGSSKDFQLTNSDIIFAGDHGLNTNSVANGMKLSDVKFQWCLNIAIETNTNDFEIRNFKVYDTYPLIGHGGNGDGSRGTGIAIRHLDHNALVSHGEIQRSGNCAISFKNEKTSAECNNITIEYVDIDSSNIWKDDQGAVYTHVGGYDHPKYYNRIIRFCKITNTLGNYYGTDKTFKAGFAIYGDIGSTDLTIHDCEISGASRAGIFMNFGAMRWDIRNNIISNNGGGMGKDTRGTQIYTNENDAHRVKDNIIQGNTIIATDIRKLIYIDNSFGYATAAIGVVDGNQYECPSTLATSAFITRTKKGIVKRSFASWQSLGFDKNGKIVFK